MEEQVSSVEHGNLIVGLDVGSTKICTVIGEIFPDRVEVLGVGIIASVGMKKGVVVNIEATVDAIRRAVTEAENMAGCDVESVFVGVSGEHVKGFTSPGILAINNREIRQQEIDAVIQAARTVKISDNQQIIHVLPQEFMVDDHTGIQNPIGMTGIRLVTNVHIVTADMSAIHNILASCNRAGLKVDGVALESVAASHSVLSADEMERGVALIDIGGGATNLAIFANGSIKHNWELGLGGNNLTSDLSVGLRTPLQEAEEVKYRYGCAMGSMIKDNRVIEVPSVGDRKPRKVQQRIMVEMIEARVEEIFDLVNQEIGRSGFRQRIGAGLVLTGGSSLLANIADMAEDMFDMPVRLGFPQGVCGRVDEVNSPRCSTAVGLVLYGGKQHVDGRRGAVPGVMDRLRNWFKSWR